MRQDPVLQAQIRYNPQELCAYLTKTANGYAIVDKARAIQSKDDERLFSVILYFDYRCYRGDENNTTIYFQVLDGEIYGGAFNLIDNQPITNRRLITSPSGGMARTYKFSLTEYMAICQKIADT